MMLNVATMNYTRKRVLRAVRELSRNGERVTHEQIAAHAECSTKTVQRALSDLKRDGRISTIGNGKGHGFRYEVSKNANA